MKKTLKQFIFETLDNGKYLMDRDLAIFCDGEPNYYQAELYKREWKKRQQDRNYFEDKDIERIEHYKKSYKAKLRGSDYWLKISKIYFNEIKKHFLKDESRPDLKEVEMYYKPIIHYKGNKLYNIEFLGDTIMGHFCKANWKDKDENNKEKLGLFYERELEFDK
jgi:hypothetical protein